MRRFLPLVLILALAGCKSETPEESGSAAPSAAPALGPAAMGMLLDEAEGLRFIRVDPDRAADQREETLAKLAGVHGKVQVSWAPSGTEAIVWRGRSFEDPPVPAAAWQVNWGASPAATPAPFTLPTGGDLEEVGYDPQGRPVALLLQSTENYKEPKKDAKGQYLEFEGKRYDVPEGQEGLQVLAHAFTYEAGGWKRTETVQTTTGWDYGAGTKALAAAKTLGARTSAILDSLPEWGDVKDPKRMAALNAIAKPKDDAGEGWASLPGDPPLFGWTTSIEFTYLTNRLVMDVDGKPQALSGLDAPEPTEGDNGFGKGLRSVTAFRHGPLLLVTDRYVGTHPRLLDLASRGVKFSSDAASAAVFWPGAGELVATPEPSAEPEASASP